MINNSCFPDEWTISKVVIIEIKNSDPVNRKNDRPISMLPNSIKEFESCVNNPQLKLFI